MNRIVKYMEWILITTIISVYLTLIYTSVMYDRSIFFSYLVFISFIHYLVILVKSPGSLLDLGNASVRGLCRICNRVRGTRTRHCYLCDKCYNKRDHHCILIGRCIAADNLKEVFLCCFFLFLFLSNWMLTKPQGFIIVMPVLTLLVSICWICLCVAHDKTTAELYSSENKSVGKTELKQLLGFIFSNPIQAVFPFAWTVSKIEY